MVNTFLKSMLAGGHFSFLIISFGLVQVVTETLNLMCQPNTEHTLLGFSYFSTTEIAIVLFCPIAG